MKMQDTYCMGELETDWVRSKRVVRQRCVLSPLLFGVYTEELAARMRKTEWGIKVGNEVLSILLYVDDVVVIREDHEKLQNKLDVVSMYGKNLMSSSVMRKARCW